MSFAKVGTRCQIAFRMATNNSRYNASAVDQARKLFTHTTPAQMEQMKPHFSSLALEFMILAGFFKD
jgi:hypothetical protein